MFYNYSNIGFDGLLLFGAFVFIGVYGYTTLMDRTPYAVWIEVARGIMGIAFIVYTRGWFGIDIFFAYGSISIGIYFLITILGGVYFMLL